MLLGIVLLHIAVAAIRAFYPHANTQRTHFDTIIVLGTPADEDGNPTSSQMMRVTEGVNEYKRGVASHIILTGGAAHNRFVEADVMAAVARTQGIPDSVIVRERQAKDTITNACRSLELMQQHGWHSAEIVSSTEHLPRAAMIFNKLPLAWRTHAAVTSQEPDLAWRAVDYELELLKTIRYLTYAQFIHSC